MFTRKPIVSLVTALVGATTYAQAEPAAAANPIPLEAVTEIRRARVEIYCGHNSEAVSGIRAAGRQLRALSSAVPPEVIAALDQADWLVRHRQYDRAEQALDTALAHMAPNAAQA